MRCDWDVTSGVDCWRLIDRLADVESFYSRLLCPKDMSHQPWDLTMMTLNRSGDMNDWLKRCAQAWAPAPVGYQKYKPMRRCFNFLFALEIWNRVPVSYYLWKVYLHQSSLATTLCRQEKCAEPHKSAHISTRTSHISHHYAVFFFWCCWPKPFLLVHNIFTWPKDWPKALLFLAMPWWWGWPTVGLLFRIHTAAAQIIWEFCSDLFDGHLRDRRSWWFFKTHTKKAG